MNRSQKDNDPALKGGVCRDHNIIWKYTTFQWGIRILSTTTNYTTTGYLILILGTIYATTRYLVLILGTIYATTGHLVLFTLLDTRVGYRGVDTL